MRTWLGALILAAGCASAPIRPADQSRLAAADARVLEGCYDCLTDARRTFEQLAVGRARPFIVARLFEVNVLIGLREGELARDPSDAFARAETLLPQLPPAMDAALALEVARATLPDGMGTPRAVLRAGFERARPLAAREDDVRARLGAAVVNPAFRDYLLTGFACLLNADDARRVRPTAPTLAADAPPLLRYRLAICPLLRPEAFGPVMDAVPGFVEAGLYRARLPTLAFTAEYIRNQRLWLTAAYDRFKDSPSATYALGAMFQTVADCRSALRHYDETLALQPAHEYAAMQRVVCLGHVSEHDAAIAGATTIIERGYEQMIADAYYWRAWNHHRLERLTDARADVDRSLAIAETARAHALAGHVAYDQREMDRAERHLTEAVRLDDTLCLARWHLGMVQFARESWAPMGDAFTASGACYKREADQNVKRLETIRNGDLDPEFKALQIAGFEAVIREDRTQEQGSYLNAANGLARSEQYARALGVLKGVPDDSPHAASARELRAYLVEVLKP